MASGALVPDAARRGSERGLGGGASAREEPRGGGHAAGAGLQRARAPPAVRGAEAALHRHHEGARP
eukprot:2590399-Rhodomonas_salina.1